jgi:hypothetical protein
MSVLYWRSAGHGKAIALNCNSELMLIFRFSPLLVRLFRGLIDMGSSAHSFTVALSRMRRKLTYIEARAAASAAIPLILRVAPKELPRHRRNSHGRLFVTPVSGHPSTSFGLTLLFDI